MHFVCLHYDEISKVVFWNLEDMTKTETIKIGKKLSNNFNNYNTSLSKVTDSWKSLKKFWIILQTLYTSQSQFWQQLQRLVHCPLYYILRGRDMAKYMIF